MCNRSLGDHEPKRTSHVKRPCDNDILVLTLPMKLVATTYLDIVCDREGQQVTQDDTRMEVKHVHGQLLLGASVNSN